MRNILITGGCGFVGQHLTKVALQNDFNVIIVDNFFNSEYPNWFDEYPKQIKFIQGDITNQKTILELNKLNFDYIVHLAAFISVIESYNNPQLSNQTNTLGFLNILNLAKDKKVKNFVYASSAAVYGNKPSIVNEGSQASPLSPYGAEKLINEHYALAYSEKYNINTVGLRYFNIYGEGQKANSPYSGVIRIFTDRARNDNDLNIFGDGNNIRDFIYVKDIVDITFNILINNQNKFGIYNVCTSKPTSIFYLASTIKELINPKVKINFQSAMIGDIKYSLGDNSKLINNFNIQPEFMLKSGLSNMLK